MADTGAQFMTNGDQSMQTTAMPRGYTSDEVLLCCEGITMMQATESSERLNPASAG